MTHDMDTYSLFKGDCLVCMGRIPDKSIDLIVTDPPYTMTKRGKSCRPNWMPSRMGDNVFDGELPNAEMWIKECFRVLKDGTHFYTFCNTNDIGRYLRIAEDVGFKLHNIITMIKDTKMPNKWYLKSCELILFFRKGKAKPINDMTSRDWMQVEMPKQNNGKVHITQKPLVVVEKLVTNSTKEGEVVMDPFMGSGTTGVAAVRTNRKFIGIEIDDKHFATAENRIVDALKYSA